MDKERLFRYLDRKYSSKSEIIPNIPLGEDADAIWADILQSRRERSIKLPLTNVNGDPYWYILTSKMISASEVIVDELMEQENTAELHKNSVATIEEIFYTGFMEGAQISVQDAMEFLQSGEEPESVEELILMNSRQAAGFAAENMYHAIDSNYLHNLAYFLTDGLDNGGGDYRITDTVEIPSLQGEVVQLPPAAMIPEQTERFAEFLADTATHPLIKAAAAQAWVLAYRPFPEGNERLARLLSNVILIRAGYTFFGNTSISSVLARTSYDYFRAIANILRVENGADLTYFLEYYLVALSSAVRDMRNKREHHERETIEEEQKMAMMPLGQPEATAAPAALAAPVPEQDMGKPRPQGCARQEVEKALQNMRTKGVKTFTATDVMNETGYTRKYIHNILEELVLESEISKYKREVCNKPYIFSFEKESSETEHSKNPIISALLHQSKKGSDNARMVAKKLLEYIHEGKRQFTSPEIAGELGISVRAVSNCVVPLQRKELIRENGMKDHYLIYEILYTPEEKVTNRI